MPKRFVWSALIALVIAFTVSLGTAGAHESREVTGRRVVVGWGEEPAFAGFLNEVSFRVTEGDRGVEGLQMKVEVIFGDKDATEKTPPMELTPAFRDPGHYSTPIVPTRSGTYTFHITGQLGGEPFDQYFTSGEETFDSIAEPKGIQFPVKDPSIGELSERSERVGSRADGAVTSAGEAADDATKARNIAYTGAGTGALGLVIAVISLLYARKKPTLTS